MLKKSRPDGTLINVNGFFTLLPYLMPSKTESAIYFEQEIETDTVTRYLAKVNDGAPEGEKKYTFFHIFLCSVVRIFAQRPKLNRFIVNYRYYQRNNISINFVARKAFSEEGDDEVNVTIKFSPYETLETISRRIKTEVQKAKSPTGNSSDKDVNFFSKIPSFILKFVASTYTWLDKHNLAPQALLDSFPFYASAFIAHVGSIGVDAPYHHNFEIGTTGLFIAIGTSRTVRYLDENMQPKEKNVVTVRYTLDDKVADGFYCSRALNMLKDFMEHPEKLEIPPEICDETLAELKLTGYPPKNASSSPK